MSRRAAGKCSRREVQRGSRVKKGDMEVGSRRAYLKHDEFVATADSNIEFITAGDQIDLIGTSLGKGTAKGPGA